MRTQLNETGSRPAAPSHGAAVVWLACEPGKCARFAHPPRQGDPIGIAIQAMEAS